MLMALMSWAILISCIFAVNYPVPVRAAESLPGDPQKGHKIYLEFCADCHGPEGRGDGPRASLLAPGPGNFVSAATSVKSDEELLRIITNGVPRTAMQGWKHRLSEQDHIDVLAFIRSLVHFQEPSLTPPPPEQSAD